MSWSPPAWGCRLTQAACRGIGAQGPLKPTSRAPLERGPETKTVLTSQPGAWCPLESWEERTSEDLTQGQELQEAPPACCRPCASHSSRSEAHTRPTSSFSAAESHMQRLEYGFPEDTAHYWQQLRAPPGRVKGGHYLKGGYIRTVHNCTHRHTNPSPTGLFFC